MTLRRMWNNCVLTCSIMSCNIISLEVCSCWSTMNRCFRCISYDFLYSLSEAHHALLDPLACAYWCFTLFESLSLLFSVMFLIGFASLSFYFSLHWLSADETLTWFVLRCAVWYCHIHQGAHVFVLVCWSVCQQHSSESCRWNFCESLERVILGIRNN